ncbi:MAG: formate dehydrogenase accessory sulfurtransferase FdhD [Clostridia bacterium]
MNGKTASVRILRYDNGVTAWEWDLVPKEHVLTVWIGDEMACELNCSADALEDLAVGHLVGTRRLRRGDDVRVYLTPGDEQSDAVIEVSGGGEHPIAGGSGEASPTTPGEIHFAMQEVVAFSDMFRETGGAHCSGYFEEDAPEILRDDVARHNTIDKIIGAAFRTGRTLDRGVLCTTGRVSTEIAHRCLLAGVRILVSRGAPTSSAITLARAGGLALVGFTRGSRFNCYSHPQRIAFPDES